MKRFLIGFLLGLPFITNAQSNFRKGYIVTNSQDTIKGYINYKEQFKSPSTIEFKPSLGADTKVFTLENCSSYVVDDFVTYQRYAVSISMDEIETSNLSSGPDSSSRIDTVFLKIVQTGKNVMLFYYRDKLKIRYYLKDKTSKIPYELIRQVYLDPNRQGKVIETNRFIGQLRLEISGNGLDVATNEKKLTFIKYDELSIGKIVSLINEQKQQKSRFSKARLFAGGGIVVSKIGISGQSPFNSPEAKINTSFMPALSGGLDVFANPSIGKWVFRIEAALMMSKNEASVPNSNINAALVQTFDEFIAAFNPQIIYNIYNTDDLKVFVGAGLELDILKSKNIKLTSTYPGYNVLVQEDNLKLETLCYSFPVKAGLVLNKKFEGFVSYIPPHAIVDYYSWKLKTQRLRIGVNYLFGKH